MAKKAQKISSYFAVFKPAKEGGYNVSSQQIRDNCPPLSMSTEKNSSKSY